jgi:predicted nicotinamide N-methyase
MMLQQLDSSWTNYKEELFNYDASLLYYPQRLFEFVNSSSVLLNQSVADVGTTIWDAEVILAHELDKRNTSSESILEIGAGTCLAGIVGEKLGNTVHAQELISVIPWTSECCKTNNSNIVLVGSNWGEECVTMIGRKFDMIIMADVLYHPDAFDALICTIVNCCHDRSSVWICYEKRRRDLSHFFSQCDKHLTIESIQVFRILTIDNIKQTDICLHKFILKV